MTKEFKKLDKTYISLPFEITQEIKDGTMLAGDDLDETGLKKWFEQEQEAFYHEDKGGSEEDPWYGYMRYVNNKLAFSKISKMRQAGSISFIGPASGIEVEGFLQDHQYWTLNFVEASENFKTELKRQYHTSNVVDALFNGDIRLNDTSQDIVCAFSVLHHIANIHKVIQEIYRIIKPDGLLFIREPCSSMGDWRYERSASPNERGISKRYLTKIALDTGFFVKNDPIPLFFEPINKFLKKTIGFSSIPFSLLYTTDRFLSWIVSCNDHYWRDTFLKKNGPSSYFYVFQKPGGNNDITHKG